jgi:hypothetical protein
MSTGRVSSTTTAKPDGVTDEKANFSYSSASPQNRKTVDWWVGELIGVVVSAIFIVSIAVLLYFYDGQPAPSWSYTYHGRVARLQDKAAHLSFNAILSLLSTAVRLCLVIPITSGLAQLKWVWMAEKKRALTDLTDFEAASRQGVLDSIKLIWRLKGR